MSVCAKVRVRSSVSVKVGRSTAWLSGGSGELVSLRHVSKRGEGCWSRSRTRCTIVLYNLMLAVRPETAMVLSTLRYVCVCGCRWADAIQFEANAIEITGL